MSSLISDADIIWEYEERKEAGCNMLRIKKWMMISIVMIIPFAMFWLNNLPLRDADYIVVSVPNREKVPYTPYVLAEDKETKVIIIGKCPEYELSYVFLMGERNKFRIYGKKNEELSGEYGCLVWDSEEWEILSPIKRDYDKLDWESREKHRYFANIFTFDEYDRSSKDYTPVVKNNICIGIYEKEYLLKQDGYYLVFPQKIDNSIVWNLCKDQENIQIQISGNTPENFLNDVIINGSDEGSKETGRNNYFVVEGEMAGDLELYVKSWKLCVPFTRFDKSIEGSRYGFTEEDIENGMVTFP